uniref:tRNA-synt_2c domain-containing protein n=1 Tax=Heterorhabditis bacteriophora TaxID=37862 RepID=A0A1I7XAQ1_HETBA
MGIETNISLTERSEMLLKTAKFGSSLPFVASIRNRAKGVIVNNPSADFLPYKGIVADRKSVKVSLEAGKSYAWCSCGHSNKQVFYAWIYEYYFITCKYFIIIFILF